MKTNSKKKSDGLQVRESSLEEILSAVPKGRTSAISYAYSIAQRAEPDSPWKQLAQLLTDTPSADLGYLCEQAGIEQRDFLAEINRELFPLVDEAKKFANTLSTAVVAQHLPRVVQRGMLEATKPEGITDRHFILQKEGFHVAPKGTQINVQQVNQQASGLPVFEDEVKGMAAIFQEEEAPLLGPGDPDYIDTELEEDAA